MGSVIYVRSELSKLYCKVTRNEMVRRWIIYLYTGVYCKNYWVVRGWKHSLTLRRGRCIARWKEIYKLHSRSYGTSRAPTRASDPSWRSSRNGGTFGRTLKRDTVDRMETRRGSRGRNWYFAWKFFCIRLLRPRIANCELETPHAIAE